MNQILMAWLPFLILGFNAAMFIVIKFNDMVHIGKTLLRLEKKLDNLDEKIDKNSERISTIEGTCAANHK